MDIRPAVIAGRWYPGDPKTLRTTIDEYVDQVGQMDYLPDIQGVVVPHAGLRYSGAVAAHGFKSLLGRQYDAVVVISPYHNGHDLPVLTTAHDAYQTPLGVIPVDIEARDALAMQVDALQVRHDPEHAIEIELPFLQVTVGHFRLLPVMLARQGAAICRRLAQALVEIYAGKDVLVVASSDLSHYYPQETALRLDKELLRRLEAFDPESVLEAANEGVGYACGRGAIATVLWVTQMWGANRVRVVRHATSGDVSGDYGSVVGYAAAVIGKERGLTEND